MVCVCATTSVIGGGHQCRRGHHRKVCRPHHALVTTCLPTRRNGLLRVWSTTLTMEWSHVHILWLGLAACGLPTNNCTTEPGGNCVDYPSKLYNHMIQPFVGYGLRAMFWYQVCVRCYQSGTTLPPCPCCTLTSRRAHCTATTLLHATLTVCTLRRRVMPGPLNCVPCPCLLRNTHHWVSRRRVLSMLDTFL